MPSLIQAESGSAAYKRVLSQVLASESVVSPRGLKCRELTDVTVEVKWAYKAVPQLARRLMNPKIGAAEYCQLLAGVSCLSQLDAASNGKFSQFADAGALRGAYGPRVYYQLPVVADLLEKDPDSRQAVVTVFGATAPELAAPKHDVPCTVALMFKIRDGRLNCTVIMRSSDAWLGIPYDWWQFSRLQQTMAWALSALPGSFTFFASSLHLYERNAEAAEAMADSEVADDLIPAITGNTEEPGAGHRFKMAQDIAERVVFGEEINRVTDIHGRWYQRHLELADRDQLCDICRYVRPNAVGGLCLECHRRLKHHYEEEPGV